MISENERVLMAGEKVSFFDAIAANKRNSWLLIFFMLALFSFVILSLAYALNLGYCAPIFGFGVLGIYAVTAYFKGDSFILGMNGAKEATREEYPFLYNIT